jgi:hypothetical protein
MNEDFFFISDFLNQIRKEMKLTFFNSLHFKTKKSESAFATKS